MAQQNHNAAYLTVVDGITVWERLRVIRNFLTDRRMAVKMAEMGQEKFEEMMTDESVNKWDKREAEILNEHSEQLLKEAKNEVAFLEKLEAELAKQAEKTRIAGKTDDEMYEINYFEELIQIQLLDVQSEMMAVGHITPNTMKTLIKNPRTMERVVEMGLLAPEAGKIASTSFAHKTALIGAGEPIKIGYTEE